MDLRTTFCGLETRTPYAVASLSVPSPGVIRGKDSADNLMKFVEAGAGLVTTHYVCTDDLKDYPAGKEPTGFWGKIEDKDWKTFLFTSDERTFMARRDQGLETIRILKERVPKGVIVQANIVAPGVSPERWADHAKEFEDAGADVIELDPSCSLFGLHDEKSAMGVSYMAGMPPNYLADMPDELSAVIKAVTAKVKIPVGFKLSPETGFPRFLYVTKAAYDAGAKFVSCTNTIVAAGPIDIYNHGKPVKEGMPLGLDRNLFWPVVGGGRFLGRRTTALIKLLIPGIEVVGITGILKAEHAVDYIMLGAQIVQVSSGICIYGSSILKRIGKLLERFMETQGYKSIDDFRGEALQHFELDVSKVDFKLGQKVAVTDETACTGCGICCETICPASYMEGGVAKVNEDACTGCNQCELICPAGARKVVYREKPRPVGVYWK